MMIVSRKTHRKQRYKKKQRTLLFSIAGSSKGLNA